MELHLPSTETLIEMSERTEQPIKDIVKNIGQQVEERIIEMIEKRMKDVEFLEKLKVTREKMLEEEINESK